MGIMGKKKPAPDRPREPLRLLVSDPSGRIYDHPRLIASGERGNGPEPIAELECIPLPRGSDLFALPGRAPIGIDPNTGRPSRVDEWLDGEARAVAAWLAPAYTSTLHASWHTRADAPALPTYAYTVVGFADGRYWTAAFRVDPDPRQDPWRFHAGRIEAGVGKRRLDLPGNRVAQQLERCALEYKCRAAQNFFLERHEAPLPVSIACNAQCVGCISLQPDGQFRASHERLDQAPRAEEVAAVALGHLERVPDGVVSFGQGCEGEPLLLGGVLVGATRLVRAATARGTINLNSNGSKPDVVRALCDAGLDSMRASMNSPRPDVYEAYYRPRGYSIDDVVESLRIVKTSGGHIAINLLCFPGVTDTESEAVALSALIRATGLDMIQMRNLNIDPELYRRILPAGAVGGGRGMSWLKSRLAEEFPDLRFGYFNPKAPRQALRHPE
jgi:pyruvate-formate lyase-activating enzyme